MNSDLIIQHSRCNNKEKTKQKTAAIRYKLIKDVVTFAGWEVLGLHKL